MSALVHTSKRLVRSSARGWAASALVPARCHLKPSYMTTFKRPCSSSATTSTETASVVELQALAARIVHDPDLAARLALSPAVAELVRSAGPVARDAADESTTKESDTVSKIKGRLVSEVPLPTSRQMNLYFINNFLPFVGFGFCDNFIMIIVGDLVDAKLGVALGISTMAAAAIGNTFSDIVGIGASGFIETANAALGIPSSGLTSEQRADIRMRILKNTACATGITLGCILGMAPLFYPEEWRLWPSRDQNEQDKDPTVASTEA